MALFRQVYVVDTNGQPVGPKAGRIYAVEDITGTTPLDVTDSAGIPMATVSVSELGVNQSFQVAEHTQVRWISEDGLNHVIFESLDAMEEQAASAVATSSSALQQVSRLLENVGIPGGIAGLNAEGNVVDANGDVVGNDTRRAGSVIWRYGSETPRGTASRDVMVIWITEGNEMPREAVPGVDIWMNGAVVE